MGFLCCIGGRDPFSGSLNDGEVQLSSSSDLDGCRKQAGSSFDTAHKAKPATALNPPRFSTLKGCASSSSPVSDEARNNSLDSTCPSSSELQPRLCSPSELIADIESMIFVGSGAYACVYKGKSSTSNAPDPICYCSHPHTAPSQAPGEFARRPRPGALARAGGAPPGCL